MYEIPNTTIQFKRRKGENMKKHILSLTLGSLLVSTLSAEDDGFYTSVGYQIGEAAQMVTKHQRHPTAFRQL